MTTRSLSLLTREESHYVVRYISDSSIQLRQRSYIKTDGAIVVGSTYPTQWGAAKDVEDAVILHAGGYGDMRQREAEEKRKTGISFILHFAKTFIIAQIVMDGSSKHPLPPKKNRHL